MFEEEGKPEKNFPLQGEEPTTNNQLVAITTSSAITTTPALLPEKER